jgi:hypothetical protein
LNTADKFIIRKSLLELATQGVPRATSLDYQIKQHNHSGSSRSTDNNGYKESNKIIVINKNNHDANLWDCVTALGAQLSRPPYDPYREIINLGTKMGRRRPRAEADDDNDIFVALDIPLLIYGHDDLSGSSGEALHMALNHLAENEIRVGLISKAELAKDRRYFLFQKIEGLLTSSSSTSSLEYDSDGLVLEYRNPESIEVLQKIRNKFAGPIIIEVDEGFCDYADRLLDAGADGLLVDGVKITTTTTNTKDGDDIRNSRQRYKGKHTMRVIRDARAAIDGYCYKRKLNDGAYLVVAGDVNNSGNIVKAAALGVDVIGYSISVLIAIAEEMYSGNSFSVSAVAERICHHILGTIGEIKGLVGALGYSDFHNVSSCDLRTSSIEASLQADIILEGTNKTYRQIVEQTFDDLACKEGIEIEATEKQKILESILVDLCEVL